MKVSDFSFDLPPELIARAPAPERTGSRLLHLNGVDGALEHLRFTDLPSLLRDGDLLVFNNTRVVPARFFGRKATGGAVEILVERVLDEHSFLAHIRASKAPKPGSELTLLSRDGTDAFTVVVDGRQEDLFEVSCPAPGAFAIMEAIGHVPLPPYIDRPDEGADHERYQTVYAQHKGAVAAPTAGLHFDEEILSRLQAMGVEQAFVTLHVGAGTFQNVRVDNVVDHRMHYERIRVDDDTAGQINRARREGRRVIAVGTTSLRTLESMACDNGVSAGERETNLFIYPGYEFKVVDALITNFHLSESTLLMLVSAFAGKEHVLNAYREAIERRYRFFSYGDAMFMTPMTGRSA